eukprot:5898467-Prorocentrum_lima.AAC.1
MQTWPVTGTSLVQPQPELPSATIDRWQLALTPMRVGAVSSMEAFGEDTAGIAGPAGAFSTTANTTAYSAEG